MAEGKVLTGAGLRGQVAGKTALSTVGKSGFRQGAKAQQCLVHWKILQRGMKPFLPERMCNCFVKML